MLDRWKGSIHPTQEIGRRVDLQQIFAMRKPPVPSFTELTGQPAALRTNEIAPPGFAEAVQARKPDSYIIAVGAGVSFALPSFFLQENPPKGIVIADAHPGVAAVGRAFVHELKGSLTFNRFYKRFLGVSLERQKAIAKELASHDPDETYRNRAVESLSSPIGMLVAEESRPDGVDIVDAVRKNYRLLKKLAREGNLVVNYTDITDPEFIAAVRSIPDYLDGTNVIYLSNIKRYALERGDANSMTRLSEYAKGTKVTVFIDTNHENDYQLEVHDSLPQL